MRNFNLFATTAGYLSSAFSFDLFSKFPKHLLLLKNVVITHVLAHVLAAFANVSTGGGGSEKLLHAKYNRVLFRRSIKHRLLATVTKWPSAHS